MSWTIEGDIAVYRVKNFCMVLKIRVVELSSGSYELRDKVIYVDDAKTMAAIKSRHNAMIEYPTAIKDAKDRQFAPSKMQEYLIEENDRTIRMIDKEDIGAFSNFIFRECEWCGIEFKKTATDRVVCKGKCRTAMSRARADVRESILKKSDKEVCVEFPNGSVCIGGEYDTVSYKGSSCKLFNSLHNTTSSMREEAEWVFYFEKEDDLLLVCDIEGDLSPRQLILIYKEARETEGMVRPQKETNPA